MAAARTSFFDWLRTTGHGAYPSLARHAEANDWPVVESLPQAWALIDAAATPDATGKAQLRNEAALAFVSYQSERTPDARLLGLTAFGIGVFLFMAATLGILALAMFDSAWVRDPQMPLLARLSDVAAARGLITFVFTVGVIALALIIVTANVTSGDGDSRNFERSKEILTSLIAIMGTIMGFYFGKADDPPAQPTPTQIEAGAAANANGPPTPAGP